MHITLHNHEFTLLHEKALYKADESLLIIADVHLGKARHFRKEGLSIPSQAQQGDYDNLHNLFTKIAPAKIYFLGDLFHSDLNNDWRPFTDLIMSFPDIDFTLVKGNHDRIKASMFAELDIAVVDNIDAHPFLYTHAPLDEVPEGMLNIVGHIHPGIVLSGMGRQSLKLPCFHHANGVFILPAFGVLTGLYSMDRNKETNVYVVLPDSVRKI